MRPHGQNEVEDAILEFLESGAVWTTQQITKGVKVNLDLVSEDLQRAAKRPNEAKIDQIIANALQARRNLCKENLIERVNRGEFQITLLGKDKLTKDRVRDKDLSTLLDKMYPDGL